MGKPLLMTIVGMARNGLRRVWIEIGISCAGTLVDGCLGMSKPSKKNPVQTK